MPSLPGVDSLEFIFQDEDTLDCVPACVASIIRWSGVEVDIDQCREALWTSPDIGTDFADLRDAVERLSDALGRPLRLIEVDDLCEVESVLASPGARPALVRVRDDLNVLQIPALEEHGVILDHSVVVVAVDEVQVLLFDPLSLVERGTSEPTTVSRKLFERIWVTGYVLVVE